MLIRKKEKKGKKGRAGEAGELSAPLCDLYQKQRRGSSLFSFQPVFGVFSSVIKVVCVYLSYSLCTDKLLDQSETFLAQGAVPWYIVFLFGLLLFVNKAPSLLHLFSTSPRPPLLFFLSITFSCDSRQTVTAVSHPSSSVSCCNNNPEAKAKLGPEAQPPYQRIRQKQSHMTSSSSHICLFVPSVK